MLDAPRPKRRTLTRVVVPIALTAAAIVAIVVAGAGRDTRAELEYLESMQSQVMAIAVDARNLTSAAGRLQSIDRVEWVAVTDAVRADISLGLELTQTGVTSDSLLPVNAMYREALVAWNRGVTGLASGVLVAADEPSNSAAAENIADALAELRAGDRFYVELVGILDREDVPSPLSPMPEVVLMPMDGGLVSLSKVYAEAARSPRNTLALRAGLGVAQLVSDPPWALNPDDQAVLPSTDQVIFSVVVRNSGNVASFPETVTLTMSGGPELVELSSAVEPLEPGRQRTIVFEPIAVESGLVYEVSAALMVTNADSTLDDNEISVVFMVNEGA